MNRMLPFIALAIASCTTTQVVNAGPAAAFGEFANVNGLRVRPLKVIEDSRCPINAVCVWPGRLVVRTEVVGGAWRQTRDLELGKPQQIADGALTLVAVVPAKVAGASTDPHAYRFTFDFQGGL